MNTPEDDEFARIERESGWRKKQIENYQVDANGVYKKVEDEGMVKYDGYDEAIIGTAYIWRDRTQVQILVYDAEEIRNILMKRDGMEADEAREFIEFNVEGGYLGTTTPVLVWTDDYV